MIVTALRIESGIRLALMRRFMMRYRGGGDRRYRSVGEMCAQGRLIDGTPDDEARGVTRPLINIFRQHPLHPLYSAPLSRLALLAWRPDISFSVAVLSLLAGCSVLCFDLCSGTTRYLACEWTPTLVTSL